MIDAKPCPATSAPGGTVQQALLSTRRRDLLRLSVGAVAAFAAPRMGHSATEEAKMTSGEIRHREYAKAGLLLTYGPNLQDQFRRSAIFVDKIFKGAKPADLPVEQPTKFELVINLKTAKALGVEVPTSLLQRADEVIE